MTNPTTSAALDYATAILEATLCASVKAARGLRPNQYDADLIIALAAYNEACEAHAVR